MPFLRKWIERRRDIAETYKVLLGKSGLALPTEPSYGKHAYHLYVIESPHRDALQKKLAEVGISANIHYPTALPYLLPYQRFNPGEDEYPNARSATAHILSIPMYPELTEKDIAYIARALLEEHP